MVGSREVLKLLLAVIMVPPRHYCGFTRAEPSFGLIEGKGKPLVIRLSGVNRQDVLYRHRSLKL
ncbi:hypothetical protein ACPV3A_07135 [Paenibacillus sp. Dod16]|uniref:hypothetical protein n=1 Tax=Paenibacillus sp. Dod16 TaxID=3416392 RepID=UPI003CEEADBC